MPVLLPPNERQRAAVAAEARAAITGAVQRELAGIATSLAGALCTRYAAVTLVTDDGVDFVVLHGMRTGSVGRDGFFCADTILEREPYVVLDTLATPRTAQHAVSPAGELRFYAGAPLEDASGVNIGTVCVFDTVARASVSGFELDTLRSAARHATRALADSDLPRPRQAGSTDQRETGRTRTAPTTDSVATRAVAETPQAGSPLTYGAPTGSATARGTRPAETPIGGSRPVVDPELLEHLSAAIIVTDERGRALYANRAGQPLAHAYGAGPDDPDLENAPPTHEEDSGGFERVSTAVGGTAKTSYVEQFHDGTDFRWYRTDRVPASFDGQDALMMVAVEITEPERRALCAREATALLAAVADRDDSARALPLVAKFVERYAVGAAAIAWVATPGEWRAVGSGDVLPDSVIASLPRQPLAPSDSGLRPTEAFVAYSGPLLGGHRSDHFWAAARAMGMGELLTIGVPGSNGLVAALDVLTPHGAPTGSSTFDVCMLAASVVRAAAVRPRATGDRDRCPIVNLPLRASFAEKVAQQLARRSGRVPAVLHIDVPDLAAFGRLHGTDIEHAALREIAARLEPLVRGTDVVGRLGDHQFGILLSESGENHADTAGASRVAGSVLRAFAEPFRIAAHERQLKAWVGVAVGRLGRDAPPARQLIQNAAAAAELASLGQEESAVRYYEREIHERAELRATLERELRHAVERDQVDVWFQPQVDAKTGRIVGFEALARWTRENGDRVSPELFIDVAEEVALIHALGENVLRRALGFARAWRDRGRHRVTIGVNASPMQLQREDFAEIATALARDAGVDPGDVELELTESRRFKHFEAAARTVSVLREVGFGVAIDDLGVGETAVSTVLDLPFTRAKLDKSVVQASGVQPAPPGKRQNATALVRFAQSKEMETVAEGVETEEQRQKMVDAGVEVIQGYGFGRPMPMHEALALPDRLPFRCAAQPAASSVEQPVRR
ncbi:MAG: sensor domain-containing phosphodiesterase [Myxococcales bacterium]|nr:sensor domain-containing phosphodiesterase [Myxococcales bacterium]